MALSPQWLDELRSRITLSGVIMRTTKLTRAGREWKACCPFHNEKSPSFYVNDQKGFYHCFGCQAHGDVIRWMTDQRGLTFMDAVKELAAQAGMEVPRADPRAAEAAQQRAGLHDVMEAAQQWFVAQLATPAGAAARAYLKQRGFNQRTIERFGFGFAPDDRTALKAALARFDEPMLVEAGLLIKVDDKPPYDRFRGRLMLPIHDARERVIAFGGRVLENRDGVAKYLNSPDTPLFDKGRTLYNLHRAGPASRRTNRVVVVEGYMDVIALAAAGIDDAVAPMGTALTEQQTELLWRMADKPVLCFDGDAAGQRAAMKAVARALPLLRPGHSLQIVQLPAGQDPDDVVKKQGAKAMEALLGAAIEIEELIWRRELTAHPTNSPSEISALEANLMKHAETAPKDIRFDFIRKFRAKLKGLRDAIRVQRAEHESRRKPVYRTTEGLSNLLAPQLQRIQNRERKEHALAAAVFNGLALHPEIIEANAERLLRFADREPSLGPAVDALLDLAHALDPGAPPPILPPGILPPPPGKTRFSFLDEGAHPDDARQDLAEAVALLVERPELEEAIAAATARFATDPEGAFAEQQRLRKRKLEIESRLGQMARKRAAAAERQDNMAGGGNDASGAPETE